MSVRVPVLAGILLALTAVAPGLRAEGVSPDLASGGTPNGSDSPSLPPTFARKSWERAPVVIVPGAPASQLGDPTTGRLLWPSPLRMAFWHGNDVLALDPDRPESTSLVPRGLVRSIRVLGKTFRFRSYDGLESKLHSLGYREGDLAAPNPAEYYFFLYDWRQSVESNARKFHRAMAGLYAQLPPGTPRAIVVGHSVGGLIARYALMYGDTPLGDSGLFPPVTWAGGQYFDTLYLVATPNAGTFLALDSLQRGTYWWKHWGAFSPDVLATFPVLYDLLPTHPEPLVDIRGRPLSWSLTRLEDWQALGWGPLRPDSRFAEGGAATVARLGKQLARGKRLREALLRAGERANPAILHLIGGECQTAQRTAIVIPRPGRFPLIRFRQPAGAAPFGAALTEPGDSMVSLRTVRAEGLPREPGGSLIFQSMVSSCERHHEIASGGEMLAALERALAPPDSTIARTQPSGGHGDGRSPAQLGLRSPQDTAERP
jgi:pimeloyl-ACP methyl ester carboxylesterase